LGRAVQSYPYLLADSSIEATFSVVASDHKSSWNALMELMTSE
jgi:hypothetical protein